MAVLTLAQAEQLLSQAFAAAGARMPMARATAAALVLAEAQGLGSHGLSRVTQYLTHLRNGRALGQAAPTVRSQRGAAVLVDAGHGLAFEACGLAVQQLLALAPQTGIALAGVCNSHHAGVMVDHLRPLAQAGLVGLAFTNSPAAMAAAGGRRGVFGTNPVAAIFPRQGDAPLMIDLSLSEVARGKLLVAAKKNESIPLGWALDAQGQPTTDAQAGLGGTMLPLGAASSAKGAMLALMVELMVTALIGAQFGYEASSFFVDEGNQPGLGQLFIAIDPGALAGREHYYARVEEFIAVVLADPGVRLPGQRRDAALARARAAGIEVPDTLLAQLQQTQVAQATQAAVQARPSNKAGA